MAQDPQRTPPRQPGAGQAVLEPATTIGGRGLTIIDTAMDQVEVNATVEGTQIVMRQRVGEP